MAFVCEFISDDDVKRYGLEETDNRFVIGGTRSRQWVIDREREVYLREVSRGRFEFSNLSKWTLLLGGELLEVELEGLDAGGSPNGEQWASYRLKSLKLGKLMAPRRREVVGLLQEALSAFRGSGMYSTATSYSVDLNDPAGEGVANG